MKRARKLRRRGVTLVLVTAIGAIVSILGMAMIHLGFHARAMAARNVQTISARCAADAGLAEAMYKMQMKLIAEAVWDGSTIPATGTVDLTGTSSECDYTVTATVANSRYRIDSTGTAGTASRIVHHALKVGSYWMGIGVDEKVIVNNAATFGTYDPIGSGDGITIRSNTDQTDYMKFKNLVTVNGDVYCGPDGDPNYVIDTKANTVITGEVDRAESLLIFPDVQAPTSFNFYMGNWNAGLVIDQPGTYHFDSLTVPTNQKLLINKDVVIYVAGKMIMGNGAEVIVNGGGSLQLYLGTSLEDKNSSAGWSNLNNNDPRALKIYGLPTCTEIDLKAKTNLAAALYAPDAYVSLYNGGNPPGSFTGAITADSFEMKNGASFLFDTRLADTNINDPAAVFVVDRWWEG